MTIKYKTDGGGSILLWLELGGTKGRLQASASEHIIPCMYIELLVLYDVYSRIVSEDSTTVVSIYIYIQTRVYIYRVAYIRRDARGFVVFRFGF